MQRIPARVGGHLDAIETPALVVDLDAFERNLDRMADATRGIRLRPHAKSHKCGAIASAQIARGAIGICCQKVDEAAAFVEAGVGDVLVTNEIVVPSKIERLASLARDARIGVLVDALPCVEALSQSASRAGTTLDVYVEIDVGAHRCGVAPGEPALGLARAIASAPALHFRGLHAYHGAAQHLREPAARREAIASAVVATRATRDLIGAAGIACEIVTGAGTGTWRYERDSRVCNELQPGSYVFMDVDYGRNVTEPSDVRFEQSLFVLATVMSVPVPARAIVDAGLKAFSMDSGLPVVAAPPMARASTPAPGAGVLPGSEIVYAKGSDEHGVLDLHHASLALGDRVWLVPGHCDPTVNLYDYLVGVRGALVESVWLIEARGALG